MQDLIPLTSVRDGQQTAQTEVETARETTSSRTSQPSSSSSGLDSTCCEPTKQDRSRRQPASVDRLLALSIAQSQSSPEAQVRHQVEHTHISPQSLHRSPPIPRKVATMPLPSTSLNTASGSGYRLQVPSVIDAKQTEPAGPLPLSFEHPSTPPSPTPQVLAPAESGSKKMRRAKRPATGQPKTKAATAARPTKRRRSQTVTSRTKIMSEEGGDEGAGVADWCAGSPVSSSE